MTRKNSVQWTPSRDQETLDQLMPVLKKITLAEVDLSDLTFALAPPGAPLSSPRHDWSIATAGVLHPPIVRAQNGKGHQVITGWPVFAAAGHSGVVPGARDTSSVRSVGQKQDEQIAAFVIHAATGDKTCLTLAFHDRIQRGMGFSPAGKALFFKKILAVTDIRQAAREFLPFLDLPPYEGHIQSFVQLAGLEEPLLLSLHQGELDEQAALQLLKLPFADRLALFDIISALHLSVSNQKKLVETCRELAYRENVSIVNILQEQEVNRILGGDAANPPQRGANLLHYLQSRRYPLLSEAVGRFSRWRASLQLPAHVTVAHSQSFEKEDVTLSIVFPDQTRLASAWPELSRALDAGTGCDSETEAVVKDHFQKQTT